MRDAPLGDQGGGWEERLYPGLAVPGIPAEPRAALSESLGALGVEAEHVLLVVSAFTRPGPGGPAARADGERFLWQLEASARRLASIAESFELATQAYLAALETAHPDVRVGGSPASDDEPEPWWPPDNLTAPVGEPLELCLRRCDFAYRHVVAAHLAANVEEVGEEMVLVLHALRTLPPAGVLPSSALSAGLYELTGEFQSHLVPSHLSDANPSALGLLSGIALLRHLDATDDRSVEADIAWAEAQLSELEQVAANLPAATAPPEKPARRGLSGLFRRSSSAGPSAPEPGTTPQVWAARAAREWQQTIAALRTLRMSGAAQPAPARGASRPAPWGR